MNKASGCYWAAMLTKGGNNCPWQKIGISPSIQWCGRADQVAANLLAMSFDVKSNSLAAKKKYVCSGTYCVSHKGKKSWRCLQVESHRFRFFERALGSPVIPL